MLYQLGKFCLKEKPLPALSPPPMCEICGEFQETTEHFLLLCSWTSVVWYGSSLNTGRKKEVSHAKAGMLSYAHDIFFENVMLMTLMFSNLSAFICGRSYGEMEAQVCGNSEERYSLSKNNY